jgi:NitT/TauT family transport system substrate-binding protein
MRLHEWIALEGNYWADEGIEAEYMWDTIRAGYSYKAEAYKSRPQDQPMLRDEGAVTNACAWGSVANAGAGMGKFSASAYGIARNAIFVKPDSPIDTPADLAGQPIGVGLRAGSHFSAPLCLEKHLALDQINCVNVGGFGTRLEAILSGELPAANLLDPQISMAEQLGLKKIIEGTFNTLWWTPPNMDPALLQAYFRVLVRAEEALQADAGPYLPLWRYSIPAEFADRDWDYASFHEGEHFVHEPFPMAKYRELIEQMERWGLDDVMEDKTFEHLVLAA